MGWSLGVVGHFGLAVEDPQASARWWIGKLGLRHVFDYDEGVAVGNDAVTIALFKGTPHPETVDHISFHLESIDQLREALADLRGRGVELEDLGDEIGPEAPGSPNMGLWFRDPDGYRWELSVQSTAGV
ncbi:MAG TPA: VOC family protein [Candidatus Acidoferrales bacterium]|nr:VOC family protein [Candidatus Acidoferrales bacterium]